MNAVNTALKNIAAVFAFSLMLPGAAMASPPTAIPPSAADFADCRRVFVAQCLKPSACQHGQSAPCARYVCDPIPISGDDRQGPRMGTTLWSHQGGAHSVVMKGDVVALRWYAGRGESREGPGIAMCSRQYEVDAILGKFGR